MKKINLKQLTTQQTDLINALDADLTGENSKEQNSSINSSIITYGKVVTKVSLPLNDQTTQITHSFIPSGKALGKVITF